VKNSNSHNKVLILGAICISILAGVLSYRIADIKNQQDLNKRPKISDVFDITGEKEDPTTNRILTAIDNSNNSLEALLPQVDPFTITDSDSATARMAKQVYSDYVNQEAGNSDLTVADIAQNALGQMSGSDMPRLKYNFNNITLTERSDSEDLRLYGNNFAEIYTRNLNLVAQNQQKYSNSLAALADVYENISKELLKIKCPIGLSSYHLTVVNNFQVLADSFRLIDMQSQDPVKSLLGVKSAKEAGAENDQMFINISKYFKKNGIIFSNNEIGVIWNSN